MSTQPAYTAMSYTTTITEEDINDFASLTGDYNPLHTDDDYARHKTQFDGKIAHGALVASTISSALAKLDGTVIYVDQELSFNGPVEPGTEVTAFVRNDGNTDRKFETFETTVEDEFGNEVITGSATILRR